MRKNNTGHVEMRKLWDEDPVKIPLQKSRKRGLVLITIVLFGFALILFRLVDLMVVDHEKLSKRAAKQYMREKTLQPHRGVIWDRTMKEMAANIETESLYAMPSKMEDTRSLTRNISPLIRVSSKKLNRTLLKKKKKDFIWLERKMDLDRVRRINLLKEKHNYNAIGFLSESKRYYPKKRIASHLLGFTNIDNKGIAGLELQYDTHLRGEVSNISVGTDARGNRLFNEVKEAVSGNNLLLTIDERIQYIVERELAGAMKKWKAKAAVAVMMNPATGEILAMANRPNYDPNSAGTSKSYERRNRSLTDLFEPGSTFKTVLAAAALEEGIVRFNDEYDVSKGYIVVGGKRISDLHRNDILTFQEVIQRSSNVGAVQIGMELGGKKYYKYIRDFGFGEKTGIDFPGEIRGILRAHRDWSGTSLAALSIGQEIGVTPLQILRAYAAIANGGELMRPYIVSDIISPDGQIIKRLSPRVERRIISRKTAAQVTDILKTVVEEGGTATKAYIQGNLVAGKTGTAQIFDHKKKRYSRDKHISSFVGFVPADDPRLALIVIIYEPKGESYGGVVAAPVFKNIIEHTFAYMNVPMERDENQIILVSK
jgi:cell division protein FtsI (penicillin-binding protein 3)